MNSNRLSQLFASGKKDLLNIYFTAGYPALHDTADIAEALASAGADIIELGMPYSDPLADGTTIQQSSELAIANGMTMELLFEQVEEIRRRTQIPLVWMGYLNPVMQYGEDRFLQRCAASGIDGLIIPDLPLHEYEASFKAKAEALGLVFSFLITPQTPEFRIREIARLSSGFVYMVSSASITGAKAGISASQVTYFERIEAMNLAQPKLTGFGISDKDSFQTACRYSQGAIIGSAFIKALGEGGDAAEVAGAFVRGIRGYNM